MRPLCFLWFPSGNLLDCPDTLAAHTNVVLVESAETRAATPLAILVIFSISFEWNNTMAFANRAGNVIILKAVSVAGGAAYCEECFIDHDFSNDPASKFPQILSADREWTLVLIYLRSQIPENSRKR